MASLTQPDTLTASGRMAPLSSIHEHMMKVTAEQHLLKSLANERVSNALTPIKKLQLRDPNDPTFQEAIFGEGLSEVRNLTDAGPGGQGIAERLAGVALMHASRAERHELTTQAWDAEREHLVENARSSVHICVNSFRDRLRDSDADIANETSVYNSDSGLMELEEAGVHRIWESVAAQLPVRSGWIDALAADVEAVAEDAKQRLRESLSYAMDALVAVAHTSRGELERYASAETMSLNKASIEDRRGMAELLRRLRVREVEKEKFERESWVNALEKWRNLRTDHSINLFVARLRSDEFADPPARHGLVRDLAEEQSKCHASLTEQVTHLQSLLPPVSMSTDAIEGWRAGLSMLHEAWDASIGRSMARLEEAEAALQESAAEAFQVLKLDVARYAAADEEAQAALLEERAVGPMNERQANADAFIARLNAFMTGQSDDWKSRARKLSDFALAVATLRDDHRRSSVEIHDTNVGDLADRRTEHERRDDANEVAFQGACDDMAAAPSEHALDDKLDAALARLDDIELNYRDFHTEMVTLAESNPVKQREDGEQYQRKLCRLLRIVPNVAPLERRMAPASMPMEGDAAPPAAEAAAAAAEGGENAAGAAEEQEEEEGQWVFDPDDESKEWDFVLTQRGNQFRVWTAIYEDIYYPPPPPPPPPPAEGEEGAAEPEPEPTPEGEEGAEPAPEPEPEPEPEPLPYLEDITLMEDTIMPLLLAAQGTLLDDMEEHFESTRDRAVDFMTHEVEDLTDELDENLRRHRPRAGRLEEENRRERSLQLIEQRRRFDRFLRGAARSTRHADERFAKAMADAEEELKAQVARITAMETGLNIIQGVKSLEIRVRECAKEMTRVKAAVVAVTERLRKTVEENHDRVVTANAKFIADTFKTPEQGGAYAQECIDEYTAQLGRVDGAAGKSKEAHLAAVAAMEEGAVSSADAAHESFGVATPHHAADLGLVEALDKNMNGARQKLRSLTAKSTKAAASLADEIDTLRRLAAGETVSAAGDKTKKGDGLCAEILRCLDRLRTKLLARCKFIGALDASSVITLEPLDIVLEEPSGDGEIDEEAQKALEEAAAAAAAIAAASAGGAGDDGEGMETMLAQMEALIADCREKVTGAAEGYYAEKDVAKITRPEKIPPTLAELAAVNDAIVTELQEGAEKHIREAAAELRLQVLSLGDLVGNAAESAMEFMMVQGLERLRASAVAAAAPHEPAAAEYAATREAHKSALRPGLALPSRESELLALCAAEVDRAHAAVDTVGTEAADVAAALAAAAAAFEARTNKAAGFMMTLIGGLVMPADLPNEGAGAEAAASLQRKNLKQLRRIRHEGSDGAGSGAAAAKDGDAAAPPPPVTSERRDVEGRPFQERRWPGLNASELTAKASGWVPIDAKLPPSAAEAAAAAAAAAEGGDAAAAAEATPAAEEEGGEAAEVEPLWGFDVPCVHVAVNARNRAFAEFKVGVKRYFDGHKANMLRRLKEEVHWKGKWESLIARAQTGPL